MGSVTVEHLVIIYNINEETKVKVLYLNINNKILHTLCIIIDSINLKNLNLYQKMSDNFLALSMIYYDESKH